jgi:hypothetical protein
MKNDTAALLVAMSAATIDRLLAPARSLRVLEGCSHTKPGAVERRSTGAPRTGLNSRCTGVRRPPIGGDRTHSVLRTNGQFGQAPAIPSKHPRLLPC